MRRTIHALLTVMAALGVATETGAAQRKVAETTRFPSVVGKTVVVDASSLDIALRSADVRQIEVTSDLRISGVGEDKAEDWVARNTPVIEDSTERLTVVAQPGRGGFLGLGLLTARARLRLVCPPDNVPDLTTTSGRIAVRGDFPVDQPLRLRTATGDMALEGATSKLDVRSASGDTRVDVIRPLEHLFARTSSGDVTLTGGARDVEIDTATGDVRLENLSGSARVVTSNGKVVMSWDRLDPGAEVKVRTTSGRIHLRLPETARPRGVLTTTGGTIRTDLAGSVNERGDTLTLDGDGPILNVETASGEILVSVGSDWDAPEVDGPDDEDASPADGG